MKNKQVDSWDLSSFLPNKKSKKLPKEENGSQVPSENHCDKMPAISSEKSQYLKLDDNSDKKEIEVQSEHKKMAMNEALPISSRALMKDHSKYVTSLSFDAAGSRLASGAYDYSIKLWDFNGMDASFQPFRTINPWDGYHMRDIKFSNRGDMFLVVSGSPSPKLFDRDGAEIAEFYRGDMYIRDLKRTNGHIASISTCKWHPSERQYFMTASEDSTIRIWNIDDKRKNKEVIVTRKGAGKRIDGSITSAAFHPEGNLIIAGRKDGSLSVWNWKTPYTRPVLNLTDSHESGLDISSVMYSTDGNGILSRSCDGTLKSWDTRYFTKPVLQMNNLDCSFAETDAIFSPNGNVVVTGTNFDDRKKKGSLYFLDAGDFSVLNRMEFDSGVLRTCWNSRTNQLAVSCVDSSITMLYDEALSTKGVLLSVAKGIKPKVAESFIPYHAIYTPDEHGNFREEDDWRRERGRRRKDPSYAKIPQVPEGITASRGSGSGSVGMTEKQYYLTKIIKETDKSRDIDPREALLKVADKAEKNPKWVSHAYKKTQPKPIFDNHQEDTKEDEKK